VTPSELLDWCEAHHGQNVYVNRNGDEVTLFADDGTVTISAELWDRFVALLREHRPDVTIEPGL
jgi:hypothetical protein